MATRSFLFGLIKIDRYGYRWGYTIPQIELMAIDCPITVYPKREKEGERHKPTKQEISEASAKWESKYGDLKQGEKIDMSDLLSQFKKV
jgi:hypothetical protein